MSIIEEGDIIKIEAKRLEDGKCYVVVVKVNCNGIFEVRYPISEKILKDWS